MDILKAKQAADYESILSASASMQPSGCNSAAEAHAIGKAYEKHHAFSQCIPWYLRCLELEPCDEYFGMAAGVYLCIGKYAEVRALCENPRLDPDGYYLCAAKYELALRDGGTQEEQIQALEAFLEIQYEESYMLRLAMLYLENGREKEANRMCKKLIRLFVDTPSAVYARELSDAIKNGNGLERIREKPWTKDNVFKHISFDPQEGLMQDVQIQRNDNAGALYEVSSESEGKAPAPPPESKPAADPLAAVISSFAGTEKPSGKTEMRIPSIVEKAMQGIVGADALKKSLSGVLNLLMLEKQRAHAELNVSKCLRIYGPDGCGKTTAALASCRALHSMGLLSAPEPVITCYEDLYASQDDELHDHVQALFESAEGKCIVIENLHEFNDSGAYSAGLKLLDMIARAYAACKDSVTLIITGREQETEELLKKKQRFADIFTMEPVVLGAYTVDELLQIADVIAEQKHCFVLDKGAREALCGRLESMANEPDFTYSRDLDLLIDAAIRRAANRLGRKRRTSEKERMILTAEDIGSFETAETVEELLRQLQAMTGLYAVKKEVASLVNQMKVRKLREKAGIRNHDSRTLHMIFTGNAGTGKTTVARIIGKIYKRLGVLPKGQLVECVRKDLVAEFVGATPKKVEEKVREAMGGILFIDEAYALCRDNNDTYGREAIETLLTEIENHRDSFMVILAGYEAEMDEFLDKNQGLRSRIPTVIHFEDYTQAEMFTIFRYMVSSRKMQLEEGTDETVRALIAQEVKQKDFGNARGIRNILDKVIARQNDRLAAADLASLSREDFLLIKKTDLIPEGVDFAADKKKTCQDYIDELNALTGLASVKEAVSRLVATATANQEMQRLNIRSQDFGTLHMVFKGNAGTGKTTVARLIGNIFRELGVLSIGHFVECDRTRLVSEYFGQTAKKTKDAVKSALGGVLFIDEAYTLAQGGSNDYGREAINELVADIENFRKDLCVIIAGYSDDMDQFLETNQGLKSRFPHTIVFEDYTTDEMFTIMQGMLRAKELKLADGTETAVRKLLAKESALPDFGNARGVRNLMEKLAGLKNLRAGKVSAEMPQLSDDEKKELWTTITAEDVCALLGTDPAADAAPHKTYKDYMNELNALTGLASVKQEVQKIVANVRTNAEMERLNLPQQDIGTLHMVFKGNAGTGKTTVARIIGNIYHELGVLSKGHLVECNRSSLVAGYVGQTAMKTREAVQSALGGVLFIDEAYALASGGETDFGREAINELVADIENYRKDLCVIIAGYEKEMEHFLNANQGLKSRFPNTILFEDYSPEEMYSILQGMLHSQHLQPEEGTEAVLRELLLRASAVPDFGNARGVRNLFDQLVSAKNLRVSRTLTLSPDMTEDEKIALLTTITEEDIRYITTC